MHLFSTAPAFLATLMLVHVTLSPAQAHGGGPYRGPGSCVPPGGTGPPTAPRDLEAPNDSPGAIAHFAGPPSGPLAWSMPLPEYVEENQAQWMHWWEFQRAVFLSAPRSDWWYADGEGDCTWFLVTADQTAAADVPIGPSQKLIQSKVVPALLKVLASDSDPKLTNRTLIALAQIGELRVDSHGTWDDIFPFLQHGDPSISETAALALGLVGRTTHLEPLLLLASGGSQAQGLLGRNSVPSRIRLQATYALGLVGRYAQYASDRATIANGLASTLRTHSPHNAQLQTSAALSFGLVPLFDPTSRENEPRVQGVLHSIEDQVAFLAELLGDPHVANPSHPAALHLPRAMAQLVRGSHGVALNMALEALTSGVQSTSKFDTRLQESCVLALGEITGMDLGQGVHQKARSELMRICSSGDRQIRRFAMVALARIAARRIDPKSPPQGAIRKTLVGCITKHLESGSEEDATWAALALGMHAMRLTSARQETIDLHALAAIRKRAMACTSPQHFGGYAIALGLCGDLDSGAFIEDRKGRFPGPTVQGQVMFAFAFLGHREAMAGMHASLTAESTPARIRSSAALALGRMGDGATSRKLVEALKRCDDAGQCSALARALGQIRDRLALDPLIAMLSDSEVALKTRVGAAKAIGFICAKEGAPWMNAFSDGLNYRALAPGFKWPAGSSLSD